jgi:hypothetical protein
MSHGLHASVAVQTAAIDVHLPVLAHPKLPGCSQNAWQVDYSSSHLHVEHCTWEKKLNLIQVQELLD